jgi:hypothetical protein
MAWGLEPEDTIRRTELHDEYGGGRQGGIAPSRSSPNVLIFSDPDSGEQHGYYDRWDGDEFHYAGEGQQGDQTLDRGNGAILNHKRDGRALRVFWGSKGVVEYAGEFELRSDDPYYRVQTHESGGTGTRDVVMFRLVPKGAAVPQNPQKPARRTVRPRLSTAYRDVDPAQGNPPRDPFEVDPSVIERGLKAHKDTQQAIAEGARAHGLTVLSPGPGDPNFDLAFRHGHDLTVIEVKSLTGANETGQVRLALGQVLDYQHTLERAGERVHPVIALEKKPSDGRWCQLCERHGVALVWPETCEAIFAPP